MLLKHFAPGKSCNEAKSSATLFQIKMNKDDINTIKNSGPSQEVTNQLNQLNTRVTTLESKVQTIEQVLL